MSALMWPSGFFFFCLLLWVFFISLTSVGSGHTYAGKYIAKNPRETICSTSELIFLGSCLLYDTLPYEIYLPWFPWMLKFVSTLENCEALFGLASCSTAWTLSTQQAQTIIRLTSFPTPHFLSEILFCTASCPKSKKHSLNIFIDFYLRQEDKSGLSY